MWRETFDPKGRARAAPQLKRHWKVVRCLFLCAEKGALETPCMGATMGPTPGFAHEEPTSLSLYKYLYRHTSNSPAVNLSKVVFYAWRFRKSSPPPALSCVLGRANQRLFPFTMGKKRPRRMRLRGPDVSSCSPCIDHTFGVDVLFITGHRDPYCPYRPCGPYDPYRDLCRDLCRGPCTGPCHDPYSSPCSSLSVGPAAVQCCCS